MVMLRVGLLIGEVRAMPPSHAGNIATEATLAVARCRCRDMLATVLPRRLG
jgi:hypothetical protein